MTTRQYIGARYIPVFADPVEWDSSNAYDYLTMVQHTGETYMSKQNVPIGIQLPDTEHGEESNEYWVHMSNWNAQVETYRQEVLQYNNRITTLEDDLPLADFDSTNTVKKAIDGLQDQIGSSFDSTNSVSAVIGTGFDATDNLGAILAGFDATDTVASAISAERTARENEDALRVLAFDDVASMKASTELATNMIVHTNGYRTSGDGGAAWYVIAANGTANEMDVIECGDLFAFFVQTEDYVYPEQFGAYGDMSSDAVDPHDDTAVFDYILNTLHLNVRGHNGKKYYINDLQIWGDSRRWAIIENCDFMAVDTTADKGIYLRSFSILRDCWFRNYNIAVYKTDDHVSVECIIEKCFFERNLIAINLIAAAESVNNVIVKDCYFVKNGTDADDFDAAISATDGYGIYAQGNINGLTVENNVFEYNSNSGVYIYDNTNNYNIGVNIFGNYFEGNKNAAVYVHCSSQTKAQLSIHSNYYNLSAINIKNTRYVYWAKGSTTGLVVSENQNLVLSTLSDGANHSFVDKVTGDVKIEPVSGASQYFTLVPIRSSKVTGMVYEVVLDSALNSSMSMKKLDTTTTLGTISNGISHFFINSVDGFYLPRALASGEYIKVVRWNPVDLS